MNQFRTVHISSILNRITCALKDSQNNVSVYHFVTLCTVYGAGYALRFCSWYTSWILNLLQSKTYTYNNQYSTFKLCSYRGKTPLLALQLSARVAQQSIATRQRESCASCWPALQTASPQNSYSKKKKVIRKN